MGQGKFLLAMIALALYAQTEAAVLNVANNGIDSLTCGSENAPCRSISQAITNASEGDTIIVGPGRYGDLNRDGVFGQPGEEMAPVACGNCMIRVDKALTLVSRDGAGTTVLDAAGAGRVGVSIEANNVIFGQKRKGFSLIGSGSGGSIELRVIAGTSGVTLMGNRALGPIDGFLIVGTGHLITDNVATGGSVGFVIRGTRHRIMNNVASSNKNGPGFVIADEGQTVTGNVASGNGSDGFVVLGNSHTLSGNVATANGNDGFVVQDNSHTLFGNVASGNERSGFNISGDGHTLSRNVITGNFQTGIRANLSGPVTIRENNIFGNGTDGSNCGMINESSDSLIVAFSFWGTATGPGSNPADTVCANPGFIILDSFAPKEFKIRVKAGQ